MIRFSLFLLAILIFSGVKAQDKEPTPVLLVAMADSSRAVSYHLEMLSVVTNKCLGCHSPAGRSDDAKEALMWEKLQNMGKVDAYATLDEILEVLEEGSMPPEKIVAKYPHLKLSEEETEILTRWAETTLAKLEE